MFQLGMEIHFIHAHFWYEPLSDEEFVNHIRKLTQ